MDEQPQPVMPPVPPVPGTPVSPGMPPQPIVGGQPVPAPPTVAPQPAPVPPSGRPWAAIVAALVAGIILGLIIGLVIGRSTGSQQKNSSGSSQQSSGSNGASSFSEGQQAYARDTKRQTDIQSLQTQLEAFFSQQGYYPSLADMNNADWRATNMKSLDSGNLVDPSSNCNSSTAACLVASPQPKAYAYAVANSQGGSCESNDTTCAQYTLTATYESSRNGAKTYTKTNLD